MGYLALKRGLPLKIWKHFLERMGIYATARHVLGAGEVSPLHNEHAFPADAAV